MNNLETYIPLISGVVAVAAYYLIKLKVASCKHKIMLSALQKSAIEDLRYSIVESKEDIKLLRSKVDSLDSALHNYKNKCDSCHHKPPGMPSVLNQGV